MFIMEVVSDCVIIIAATIDQWEKESYSGQMSTDITG